MSERGFPVTVAVTRPNGQVEQVRVGTAYKNGDGFTLQLGEMSIGGAPVASASAGFGGERRSSPGLGSAGGAGGAGDGMVFPPYGRSKGMPIVGASMGDLEFYANGSRRSLADPAKARWHDKEKVLLAAIEAEIQRQLGGGSGDVAPSGSGGSGAPPFDDDGAPPHSDDDIPF